jgi:hypothetical protein
VFDVGKLLLDAVEPFADQLSDELLRVQFVHDGGHQDDAIRVCPRDFQTLIDRLCLVVGGMPSLLLTKTDTRFEARERVKNRYKKRYKGSDKNSRT